jgi:hypothetical protein
MTVEDMKNNGLVTQVLTQLKINTSKLNIRCAGATVYIRGVLLKQNEEERGSKNKSNKRLVNTAEMRLLAERPFRRVMWDLD